MDTTKMLEIMNQGRRARGLADLTAEQAAAVTGVIDGTASSGMFSNLTADAPPASADVQPAWSVPGFIPPEGSVEETPQPAFVHESEAAPAVAAYQPDTTLPAPHPKFRAHFTESFYFDQGDEFSPFGSDEATDVVAELLEERDRITETSTVRQLAAEAFQDEKETVFDNLNLEEDHVDPVLVAVGFLLIYLTGQIDYEGKRILFKAIDRRERRWGANTTIFGTMLEDVRTFPHTPPPAG